jgi:uncharacterized protein YlxP (DUF503 family)
MKIGILMINLRLPENSSLKGKRQLLKPITARLKNRFNVSVAEIDHQDLWQLASLGICCVSNEKRHIDEVLSKVVNFVSSGQFNVEMLEHEIEIISI